jgi:8-oxo-dGTP diphosphatase
VTPTYHKVGLLVLRDGRMLLCRKREGTSLLILPGGCIEPGESQHDCLAREVREELGDVAVLDPVFLATYETSAASGGNVRIELYQATIEGEPAASSEIAELVWFAPDDDPEALAPSLRYTILPDLIARGVVRC